MRVFDGQKDVCDIKHTNKHGGAEGCLALKRVFFEGSFDNVRLLHLPQFAFAGRSNVGKSSLINAILNRKIAYVSKNPGKTVLINFYKINDMFFIVDLPGYGYAKRSKSLRQKWRYIIENYLKNANLLYHVFVLVDSRHLPMESDLMFIDWLKFYNKDFSVVFTKTDKATQKSISDGLRYLKDKYGNINYFLTSSTKKKGINKLCDFIVSKATL